MSLTKTATENDRNFSTQFVAARFEREDSSIEVSGEKVWRPFYAFDANRSDYSLEKVNIPEKTVFYVNQANLTVQKSKKIYYCNCHVLPQVTEASNPPENIDSYVLQDREVKLVRPRYIVETGDVLGL